MRWPLTERAQKCLQLAWQEAQRLNVNYVGTEHMLIGLLKEGRGYAAEVLNNAGFDLRRARLDLEQALGFPVKITGELVAPVTYHLKEGPMATTVMSARSEEHQRLKKILCEFAGIELQGVRKIAVEIDDCNNCIPVFTVEKMAIKPTAQEALHGAEGAR